MAKDTEPLEMLNANAGRAVKQAEQVVEKTIDQTRGALDNYFSFMQKAFSFYPVGGTELAEKMNRYTAQNISAARDFVHKLSQAKDFQDIIRIQTEFMQTQFSVFAEQTKSLTEAFTKAATSTVKPPKN
jgi:Phasin protein